MAIILKPSKLFGYFNIACGVFWVNNQIIIFEWGIYLCQIVVFRAINFFCMDSHVQTKTKNIE
jgi:hypothetical protein